MHPDPQGRPPFGAPEPVPGHPPTGRHPSGPTAPSGPTGRQAPFGTGDPNAPGAPAAPPGPGFAAPTSQQASFGPGGPGGPGTGGAGDPAGADPAGPYAYAAAGAQRREKRGIPAWMALSGMLVVAIIAGGAGGVAGGAFAGGTVQEAPAQAEGPTMNEPPPEAPQRDPDTIAGVAQRVSPSVVSIRSADRSIMGGGSGFIIEGDYVVTNDHVSSELEGDGILVEYSDGSLSPATVVGADPSSDLAVLSLEDPIDVEPLEFGDSEQVIVGDEVIAIGAPLGYSGTVTQGIISAVNRPVTSGDGPNASRFYALQTDAAINPGNSGGPLVDTRGRVIGVNSMIVTMGYAGESAGNIGLGFAIPSLEVERVVQRLIEDGQATYADLGAEIDVERTLAGAAVESVESGGAADRAGLRSGDVIIRFDGRTVNSGQELLAMIRDRSPGDEVEAEYERGGNTESTTITLDSSD
ncbi:S1C family serine protease [Nocardiopsis sp. CC223A]|uniref:S1C family serine protease n=1 Tax=Nocardiopsis sp. CC223A TaxID=3044051 RepID=UPI0027960BC2|nr:trypsin-like peptidase domain-containing protein [Nocardiopsis sp. CC223A]